MSSYFAYSFVYREKGGGLKHYMSHCTAISKAEAKGLALDEFENDYPNCENLNLIVREICKATEESKPETPKHEFKGMNYITPEFTLK